MSLRLVILGVLALGSLFAQPYVNYRGVVNAASYAPEGLPSGGIARGSIFTLFGRGMGPAQSLTASAFPLGESLGGVSIEISQGNGRLPAYPIFVWTSQVSAIMPSNAPLGKVVVRLTYNGQPAGPAVVNVAESSVGIFSVNSRGFGPGIAQNFVSQAKQPINTARLTARPGQTMILWGTGLGAVNHADNVAPTPIDFATPVEILVGGKPAPRRYAGRSSCCAGLDQFVFDVPIDTPEGCFVPLQVRTNGAVISNAVTIAVERRGQRCSDPFNPVSDAMRAGGKIGVALPHRIDARLEPFLTPPEDVVLDYIYLALQDEPGGDSWFNPMISLPPVGTCTFYGSAAARTEADWIASFASAAGQLDAGDPGVLVGPLASANVIRRAAPPRVYSGFLGKDPQLTGDPPLFLAAPADFTLRMAGGAAVGAIEAAFRSVQPVSWTGRDQLVQVRRSGELTLRWSGGDGARDVVLIAGASRDDRRNSAGMFLCVAPADAGSFSVPQPILAGLPLTPAGALDVAAEVVLGAAPVRVPFRFNGSGLDQGFILPGAIGMKSVVVTR